MVSHLEPLGADTAVIDAIPRTSKPGPDQALGISTRGLPIDRYSDSGHSVLVSVDAFHKSGAARGLLDGTTGLGGGCEQ